MTPAASRAFAGLVAASLLAPVAAHGAVPPRPAAAVLTIDWSLSAPAIAASCASSIQTFRRRVDAIARSRGPRTFRTVVLPLENATADLNDTLAAQGFLTNVSTDAMVRAASLRCNTDAGNALSVASNRPDLYRALAAADAGGTASDAAARKLSQLWLTALRRSGAALPAGRRREFVALAQRLTDVQNRFQANLGNDATTIVISAAQAQSLPADFIGGALKAGSDGSFTVPVNESTIVPFMQNETDPNARKAFYLAYNNRGGAANVKLLDEAIALRDRSAKLIGYPNWAAFVVADKMAATPQRVERFLSQIDAALLPKARLELAEDAALKGAPLDPWDLTFYENHLRKTKYAVDQNAIKQYFPVQHVVDAVLGIYQELLGVRFTRAAVPVWEPLVQPYDVTDASSGAPLGRFYLDLYPRPGKYDHFANFGIISRRVLPDGTVRLPVSAIVGNWPLPSAGKPALLQQGDVETFFHEFGHNMAALLAAQPYATLTSGFRSDFIEAPSQMLENWAWDPGILARVSSHVTTGQPLPAETIRTLIATRYVHDALQTTQQILYATVDMRYHTRTPPFDTTAVWKETVAETTPNTFVEGAHPQAGFGHLMGGYDAGYYGYLWSKVYAQDMFSRFKAQGLTNPVAGMAYRRTILAPARLEEPDEEVRAFLGRPMSPNAFYAELGIAVPEGSPRR